MYVKLNIINFRAHRLYKLAQKLILILSLYYN